ncbi:MAG: CU044_2847 family protein [Trebonia sp.]
MAELTRFALGDGATVIVQTQDPARVVDAGLGRKTIADAAVSLREALGGVTAAASDVLAGFKSMVSGPDEVEIKLGVSFDATVGMVIANSSAGGHLDVTLRWTGDLPKDEG